MTTFALVGAGPGLGLATARGFGVAGHSIALISRSAGHLDDRQPGPPPARDQVWTAPFAPRL
ncbi:hypothetical protein [Streptomyces sp. NPDC050564]|uniref:hypothetical protein n=1 Tax=Streptomyces sp. NPDC050564 TaxID=3365631 RepID=UPI003797C812